jgi:hypothetical protein
MSRADPRTTPFIHSLPNTQSFPRIFTPLSKFLLEDLDRSPGLKAASTGQKAGRQQRGVATFTPRTSKAEAINKGLRALPLASRRNQQSITITHSLALHNMDQAPAENEGKNDQERENPTGYVNIIII